MLKIKQDFEKLPVCAPVEHNVGCAVGRCHHGAQRPQTSWPRLNPHLPITVR